jgi:hypothetical protein
MSLFHVIFNLSSCQRCKVPLANVVSQDATLDDLSNKLFFVGSLLSIRKEGVRFALIRKIS